MRSSDYVSLLWGARRRISLFHKEMGEMDRGRGKKKWKNEGARSSLQMNVEGLLPPPPRKQCYRVGGGDAC